MQQFIINQKFIDNLENRNINGKIKAKNINGLEVHKRKNNYIYLFNKQINGIRYNRVLGDIKNLNLKDIPSLIQAIINPIQEKKNITFLEMCNEFQKVEMYRFSKGYAKTITKFLQKDIIPYFKDYSIEDVTSKDVKKWLTTYSTELKARERLKALSILYNFAKSMGYYTKSYNPCKGLSKRSNQVIRYLDDTELHNLGHVFKTMVIKDREQILLKVIKLIMFTGARSSEISSLKWEYIRENKAYLPQSKTGEKVILLSTQALDILSTINNASCYVFPGRYNKTKPISVRLVQKLFNKIKMQANIQNFRLHDFRHTIASIGIQNNIPLINIGQILGHKDKETTLIYTHLNDKAIKRASQQTSSEISKNLKYTK